MRIERDYILKYENQLDVPNAPKLYANDGTADKRRKDGGQTERGGQESPSSQYKSKPYSTGQSPWNSQTKHGIFQRMLACLLPSRLCPAA